MGSTVVCTVVQSCLLMPETICKIETNLQREEICLELFVYMTIKKKQHRNPTATFHALNIPYVVDSPQKIKQQPLPSHTEQ